MKKLLCIVILLSLFIGNISAQEFSEKEIRKKLNAKKIELIDAGDNIYRVKSRKTGKWGVYQIYHKEDIQEFIPCEFDSVSWFRGYEPFTVLKNNGKYGIFLNPYEISDAVERIKFKYHQVKMVEKNGNYYALVKKAGKWGLIDWFDGFLVVDYSYDSPGEVPLIKMDSWQKPLIKALRKKLNADLIDWDGGNGDGVLKARHKLTKKWGMFQAFDEEHVEEVIPMQYDSLKFFSFNGVVTAVYNEGKVGFYLSKFSYNEDAKESVPCIYEAYQRYTADIPDGYGGSFSKLYMAVKKDGKWGWVAWETGEEKSEFKYETKEDLPGPGW